MNDNVIDLAMDVLEPVFSDSDPDVQAASMKVVEALMELNNVAFGSTGESSSEPTLQEISMNVAGRSDFHTFNPEMFEKMKKWYDPERQPFTAMTWMRTAMQQVDRRPYKVTMVDGKPFRKTSPAMPGVDYHWIGLGVSDPTAEWWNAEEIDYHTPHEKRLERLAAYQGEVRDNPNNWPPSYRDIWFSTRKS